MNLLTIDLYVDALKRNTNGVNNAAELANTVIAYVRKSEIERYERMNTAIQREKGKVTVRKSRASLPPLIPQDLVDTEKANDRRIEIVLRDGEYESICKLAAVFLNTPEQLPGVVEEKKEWYRENLECY